MRVRELMTTAVKTVRPSTAMLEARRLLQIERIRHLLVTSPEGYVQGIVTDRDIRGHLARSEASVSSAELDAGLGQLPVEKVMSRSVITIGPEADAADAARLMLEHKIGAVPVIHHSRPIGIVTETDFVRAFALIARAVDAR